MDSESVVAASFEGLLSTPVGLCCLVSQTRWFLRFLDYEGEVEFHSVPFIVVWSRVSINFMHVTGFVFMANLSVKNYRSFCLLKVSPFQKSTNMWF